MPTNEAPFDEIINKRIEEIKSSYNEILIKLQDSRKGILNKEKQEITLKVNFKNFFHVNDVINNHIKTFNSTINEKNVKLYLLASQIYKEKPEELVAAKFYLENSINGKQIKDNYDMINKVNFIDLQTDVYQKLIDDVWKLDRDELSYNFDFWERMGYKNIESNTNKKKEKEIFINLSKDQSTIYDNYNNEYINDITKEINVIKGDCKANDLLTKFNSRKFIEDEPIPNLDSSNLPNNNRDNNEQYNELLQRNKMNHNINNNTTITTISLMEIQLTTLTT